MKTACLTGITGQIGSYMCEKLLKEGYKVNGLVRRTSTNNLQRLEHVVNDPNLNLVVGDLTDASSINNFVEDHKPDLFLNFGAQSFVMLSFDLPNYTMEATGNSVLYCLNAIKRYSPKTKFCTMSSSEMYGSTPPLQDEKTIFHPRSPYAEAKLFGYHSVVNYREAYNLFASNAICFNTESPRRGEQFVTRKITRAATRIKLGLQDKLYLGNLKSFRDFTHGLDTCDAVYRIVTADLPDDYVVASGTMHSIQEFVEIVFGKLDLDWKQYVEIDPRFYRPSEVDQLQGNSTKLRTKLEWEPKYSFNDLVNEMVASDLELAKQEKKIVENKC